MSTLARGCRYRLVIILVAVVAVVVIDVSVDDDVDCFCSTRLDNFSTTAAVAAPPLPPRPPPLPPLLAFPLFFFGGPLLKRARLGVFRNSAAACCVRCEDLYITHYLTPLRGALLAQRHYLQMVAEVVKR